MFCHKLVWPVCGKKTGWGGSNDSGMAYWRPKSVSPGTVWSDLDWLILVGYIQEQTQGS